MKYLITGGSGFVGTHLIELLLTDEATETITIIDIVDPFPFEDRRVNFIKLDIREDMDTTFDIQYDWCIHLAALCKEPGFEWNEYFETNYTGTQNVIDCCEKNQINKIFFTSTMMVYQPGDESKTELDLEAPDTAYGISKIQAELSLQTWKAKSMTQRQLIITRPAVVFGLNENGNFTRLMEAIQKKRFLYVGRSSTIKSNIYVKELALITRHLTAQSLEGTYNCSFPEQTSIKKICETFMEVFSSKFYIPILPFKALLLASYGCEILNSIGLKNSIHHRRIEKLYNSTNIDASKLIDIGYEFSYDLKNALLDWKEAIKEA